MITGVPHLGGGRTNPPTQPVRPPASSSSRPPTCNQPPGQVHPPRLAPRRTPAPSRRACGPLTRHPHSPGRRKDAGLRQQPTHPWVRAAPVAATGTRHDQPRPVKVRPPGAQFCPYQHALTCARAKLMFVDYSYTSARTVPGALLSPTATQKPGVAQLSENSVPRGPFAYMTCHDAPSHCSTRPTGTFCVGS